MRKCKKYSSTNIGIRYINKDGFVNLNHVDQTYYKKNIHFLSKDYVYIGGNKSAKSLKEHLRCSCNVCLYKWSEITDDNKEGRTF